MPKDDIFRVRKGEMPLLVSMPHIGTRIPPDMLPDYQARALDVEDTDWNLDQLYDFLPDIGASVLHARYSRYVIDLNRPPDDAPMYPGAANTELCPTRFFTGDALYLEGCEPGPQARAQRRQSYWQPYHDALAAELARLREQHGFVLLWDAHSIRSQIPWLFEGRLPDLNLGSADGVSADPRVTEAAASACSGIEGLSHVVNARFKGGYITRHYGDPAGAVHALQLEMCQSLYMSEQAPFAYQTERAEAIKPVLKAMIGAALAACQDIHAR